MVSTRPLISESSSPFTNSLVTLQRALITISITDIFMLYSFLNFLARSRYIFFFSLSFNFTLWSIGTAKFTIRQVPFFFFFLFLFFLLTIIRCSRLAEIKWSVYIAISQKNLCTSFPITYFWLFIYHLFVWSNLTFLHNSQLIPLLTQWCIFLYSFGVNMQNSLIMWLIVSFVSLHNLHLIFCLSLSIIALI